jgi:hypothetical protein
MLRDWVWERMGQGWSVLIDCGLFDEEKCADELFVVSI